MSNLLDLFEKLSSSRNGIPRSLRVIDVAESRTDLYSVLEAYPESVVSKDNYNACQIEVRGRHAPMGCETRDSHEANAFATLLSMLLPPVQYSSSMCIVGDDVCTLLPYSSFPAAHAQSFYEFISGKMEKSTLDVDVVAQPTATVKAANRFADASLGSSKPFSAEHIRTIGAPNAQKILFSILFPLAFSSSVYTRFYQQLHLF